MFQPNNDFVFIKDPSTDNAEQIIQIEATTGREYQKRWVMSWTFGRTEFTLNMAEAMRYTTTQASHIIQDLHNVALHNTDLMASSINYATYEKSLRKIDPLQHWLIMPDFRKGWLDSVMEDPQTYLEAAKLPLDEPDTFCVEVSAGVLYVHVAVAGVVTHEDHEHISIERKHYGFDGYSREVIGEGASTFTILTFTRN